VESKPEVSVERFVYVTTHPPASPRVRSSAASDVYKRQGLNYPGSGWTTRGQFYFQGLPESSVTFFNQAGNVIASTNPSATDPLFDMVPITSVAAVPEPQTYLLFALGLSVIGFARKRTNRSPSLQAAH